jgi:transposase
MPLRERVVSAWENGEGSFAELGLRFQVGEASVNRWVSQKRRTGRLEPKPMGGSHRKRLVDEKGEAFLREAIQEKADHTLIELCEKYLDKFDVVVPPQTMSRTVQRLGVTRKRGSFVRVLPSARSSSSNARSIENNSRV